METQITKSELIHVLEWAKEKIHGGSEPPWAWYQYMKLQETIETILKGMNSTVTTENLQQSEQRLGGHLQLVGSTYPQDTAQCRPSDQPVQMPM